jgi:hypothetical protein
MQVEIKCAICEKTLVVIDKETVTQEDTDMYTSSVACEEHGGENIQAIEEVVE